MIKKIVTALILILVFQMESKAQIKVTSVASTFDTLSVGNLIYYQYAWDDPMDEDYPVQLKLPKPFIAFGTVWDSIMVSDGSLYFSSSNKPDGMMIVDATGSDLVDIGIMDTINFPNISSILVSRDTNEVEWMNFGFYNEYDSLGELLSRGSVKIQVDPNNMINLIYGDFSIVNPDLCFEGFGSLRPSVTYIDFAKGFTKWIIYGDPTAPNIDTLSDTAFSNLPSLGQKIILDFNKTNSLKQVTKSNISIYPNPVKDKINIGGLNDFSGGIFQVISMDGRIVIKGKMNGNTIDANQLKPGNYILKISNKGENYYSKFLKSNY